MRFESIEFKNIFAYGEAVQRVDYSDNGKLILLKGQSGAGKSAILSLPVLVLYGKLASVTKAGIANRVNKHGWVRGTIIKGQHKYVIERTFSPNSLKIWKDDVEIDNYGSSDAQDYIKTEIIEIPITTFTNMITISMKKFKSFLSMSPTERKAVVDEVFDVRIINMVFDQIKKDAKEIGQSINGDNATLYSLNQTWSNANNELLKIQQKNTSEETASKIEENNNKIIELNSKIQQFNEALVVVNNKMQENNAEITAKRQTITEHNMKLNQINEKLNLFTQSKCPTCSTPFEGDVFDTIREKLESAKTQVTETIQTLQNELTELSNKSQLIVSKQTQVNNAIYQFRVEINNLQADNRVIDEKIKASSEYQAVQNIIDQTNEQISGVKASIDNKTKKLLNLQKLQTIYSIDGVTKMVINNYLPLLNQEIAENLIMLNFPYTLTFDEKFTPHIKDLGVDVQVETLSDGEMTRVDLVVLCSLFKLLKRKFPSINILTLDESVSTLDPVNSGNVLAFMSAFAIENDLNCFIVSHTDLYLENFDEIIEVEKINGFSTLTVNKTVA